MIWISTIQSSEKKGKRGMVEDEEEEPKEEKGEVVQMAQKSIVGAFGTKFLMIQSFVGANHLCI